MTKLAVVGCGGMEKIHETGFAELSDRLRVVATVDPILERAERARAALQADRAVADYREILDDVDAVLLSLPHHLHHPIGMACLRAGKHVLMEKPLANTEAECLELGRTARDANCVLMSAYPMRFHPMVRRLRDLIVNGDLGDVMQVSIWTEQYTHFEEGHWANKAELLGGGQFFSHGCHYIDLLLWFLGEPVQGTHIGTRLGTPWMEGEGTSNVTIKFASGALAYHFGTWGARGSSHGYMFHVHGSKAFAQLDHTNGELTVQRDGETSVVATTVPDSKYVAEEMRHFLDSIEYGTDPETDADASLTGLRVIWRLYEAERQNRVADLRGLSLV